MRGVLVLGFSTRPYLFCLAISYGQWMVSSHSSEVYAQTRSECVLIAVCVVPYMSWWGLSYMYTWTLVPCMRTVCVDNPGWLQVRGSLCSHDVWSYLQHLKLTWVGVTGPIVCEPNCILVFQFQSDHSRHTKISQQWKLFVLVPTQLGTSFQALGLPHSQFTAPTTYTTSTGFI